MVILYNHQKQEESRHTFTINEGGELNIRLAKPGDKVTIIFKDRKFHAVDWQLEAEEAKTRSSWWVRGAVAAKIKELEDAYSAPREG